MHEPLIKKINIDGMVKGLRDAVAAMNSFGDLLAKVKPWVPKEKKKKKRGAGFTKRRISKRTGRSSSH